MMTEQLTGSANEVPEKKIWRRWKWIGLAIYVIVMVFNRWLPSPVVAAGYVYGIVVIANLLFHLFRYLKNRLFWRVRNRLIGAFVFVGVIPLVLLLGVVFLTGYVLLGQLAGRYLENSLHEIQDELAAIHTELAGRLPSVNAATAFANEAPALGGYGGKFPRLAARLLAQNPDGTLKVIAAWDPGKVEKEEALHPGNLWLGGKGTYQGLVREGETALMVCIQPVPKSERLYLAISAPLDRFIEERVQREKSIYFSLVGIGRTNVVIRNDTVALTVTDGNAEQSKKDTIDLRTLESRRRSESRRMVAWGIALRGKEYATGVEDDIGAAVLFVPVETIFRQSMGSGDTPQGKLFLTIIYILVGLFISTELVSLVIGATISRRITRSVHDMYQGTLALQKGDLQHRIPVRRKDQLGLLAHSFNQMSSSITRLLEEVSEKKRLEQELEIAREVQATLFPKQLPHPRGMAIFGGCEPARVVSGDYYDFILEDEARLDIVVADISGKGISAALLMANLQAAMRNQLLSIKHDSPADIEQSLASIVSHLNQQIYASSPAEKYATLFLSQYDAESRRLCYCNAGHLPPILLDEKGAQWLQPTGMVVGLLPNATYEAKSVAMPPGALLAIFTDGVTEAFNKEDEEYGEERLLQALTEVRTRTPEAVYKFVIEGIHSWQGDLPQHDDITLIIAKAG